MQATAPTKVAYNFYILYFLFYLATLAGQGLPYCYYYFYCLQGMLETLADPGNSLK